MIASGMKVHRDTFHLSYGIGRYAVGLLWYAMLTGNDIADNMYRDFDEEITDAQIELAKKCVTEICRD